jgi:hypothetical protein
VEGRLTTPILTTQHTGLPPLFLSHGRWLRASPCEYTVDCCQRTFVLFCFALSLCVFDAMRGPRMFACLSVITCGARLAAWCGPCCKHAPLSVVYRSCVCVCVCVCVCFLVRTLVCVCVCSPCVCTCVLQCQSIRPCMVTCGLHGHQLGRGGDAVCACGASLAPEVCITLACPASACQAPPSSTILCFVSAGPPCCATQKEVPAGGDF